MLVPPLWVNSKNPVYRVPPLRVPLMTIIPPLTSPAPVNDADPLVTVTLTVAAPWQYVEGNVPAP